MADEGRPEPNAASADEQVAKALADSGLTANDIAQYGNFIREVKGAGYMPDAALNTMIAGEKALKAPPDPNPTPVENPTVAQVTGDEPVDTPATVADVDRMLDAREEKRREAYQKSQEATASNALRQAQADPQVRSNPTLSKYLRLGIMEEIRARGVSPHQAISNLTAEFTGQAGVAAAAALDKQAQRTDQTEDRTPPAADVAPQPEAEPRIPPLKSTRDFGLGPEYVPYNDDDLLEDPNIAAKLESRMSFHGGREGIVVPQ